jgi:glycosyltransferase involved in cell wall biosynthesis
VNLSLCMIVKNEEKTLPQCLESVRGIVDEIIVLDTGSRDRTVEVAQGFGAQVHPFPWKNNFAIARNASLQYARGAWILVLDADERLVPRAGPLLKQAIQQEQHLLLNLVRQEIGAAQSPYSLVSRLFRNRPDLYFSRPYHALVDESVTDILAREPDWQIGYLPEVAILHDGYRGEAIAAGDKFTKARVTMEGYLADHPEDPYVCSKLGALYVEQGDVQGGIELLERGLHQERADSPVRYELHYHLGIAYSRQGDLVEAEEHYRAALRQSLPPRLKLGAYNNLGSLCQAKGELLAAKALYLEVVQIEPTLAIGYYNLGMTLKALGALSDAIAAYRRALQLNPNYAEAHQNLGVVLLKTGQVQESRRAFQQAIALHEQQNPLEAERLRQGVKQLGIGL